MEVYLVYAIQSEKDSRIYVDFSSNEVKRLAQHNSGKTKYIIQITRNECISYRYLPPQPNLKDKLQIENRLANFGI